MKTDIYRPRVARRTRPWVIGLGVTLASGPAGAAEHAHTTMQHSWHGTISQINAKMGTTSSFSFGSGSKTYVVHWDAMTHFTMVPRRTSSGARWSRHRYVEGDAIAGTKTRRMTSLPCSP